jgi:hypothetical protein
LLTKKKEEGDDDDDDEENLCNKEAIFKGKDVIEDSGGHHKLEGANSQIGFCIPQKVQIPFCSVDFVLM